METTTVQVVDIEGRIQLKLIALSTRCGVEHRVVIEALGSDAPANSFAPDDLPLVEAALKQAADLLGYARQMEWFLRNRSCGNC